jgi:hypothetical protein
VASAANDNGDPQPDKPVSPAVLVLAWLYTVVDLVSLYLALGAVAAGVVFDWKPGAWIAVCALFVHFAAHVTVGIVGYVQTMRRPWPSLPPLEDDDDDW